MRKAMIAGNWKMYKTPAETRQVLAEMIPLLADAQAEVVICPPAIDLLAAAEMLSGSSLSLGAQNMHWEREGAFTGEISPLMLKAVGCRFVIIGHSERRQYFAETDGMVSRKAVAAYGAGLIPIVCVGETLAEREAGQAEMVLENQVRQGLAGISAEQAPSLVVAYEPVWAIGTGRTSSPEMAQSAVSGIRRCLADLFGHEAADQVRILYGGSVKPENIALFMAQPDIDGALVGGASLQPSSFSRIVLY